MYTWVPIDLSGDHGNGLPRPDILSDGEELLMRFLNMPKAGRGGMGLHGARVSKARQADLDDPTDVKIEENLTLLGIYHKMRIA